uniref:Putative ovule protein n=1 Tax=Solanum chacoense TaxID=4108 RepID=A0A0V0HTN6_SOLCH
MKELTLQMKCLMKVRDLDQKLILSSSDSFYMYLHGERSLAIPIVINKFTNTSAIEKGNYTNICPFSDKIGMVQRRLA